MADILPKVSWGAGCDDTSFTASSWELVDVPVFWAQASWGSSHARSLSLSLSLLDVLPATAAHLPHHTQRPRSSMWSGVNFHAQVSIFQPTGLLAWDGPQDHGGRELCAGVMEGVVFQRGRAVPEAVPSPWLPRALFQKGGFQFLSKPSSHPLGLAQESPSASLGTGPAGPFHPQSSAECDLWDVSGPSWVMGLRSQYGH